MGLGQKLEDARNRKGISIREATESTKIRGDYLTSFEAGDFDINLPDVYLRGFVRLYARFLGMDADAIAGDLDVELGRPNKNHRKSLGSITNNDMNEGMEVGKSAAGKRARNRKSSFGFPQIWLYGSIIFAFILSIIILIYSLSSPENPSANPGETISRIEETKEIIAPANPIKAAQKLNVLNLAAIGAIDRLIICDEGASPKKYHEFTNLALGWEKTIEFKNTFRCYSSSLENLRFAVDGGVEKKAEGSGSGNFSWSK